MPVLECPNGHVTTDRDTVRCDECGEFVRGRPQPVPDTSQTATGWPPGVGLIVLSAILGAAAGGILAASGGSVGPFVVSMVILWASSTMWMVGCVCLGIHLMRRS